MNIFQLNKILLEYNKTGKLTTLAGQGGDKAAGKNFDNIAAGITNPYKQEQKKPTEKEMQYPNLAKVINQMKKTAVKGNKIVMGAALNDLKVLLQNANLQTDENGETILPFGDDVRLIQNGNSYFVTLRGEFEKQEQPQIDLTQQQMPII